MRLSELTLWHFRNLRTQELEIPPEGVALIGDNAQGKSNFLEAIYYLETLRSFRSARDEQMVAFDEDVFRVVGRSEGAGDEVPSRREVAAAFQKRGRRKKVSIDGREPDRLTDGLGHLSAVIFSPADIALVSGGPSERRRFLDIVLSLNAHGYLEELQRYRRALRNRNAALKAGEPSAVVHAWTPALVASGAEVMRARLRWIEEHSEAFTNYYAHVSDGTRATMTYKSNVEIPGAPTLEGIMTAFEGALADAGQREMRQGVTVTGPHRDDVRIHLVDEASEVDLRDYGSGGQRRTAALALRLVEAETIRRHRSRRPLILLDDVFAELDDGRSERILNLIETEEAGQVLLTAPKEADVRLRRDSLPRWRIRAGAIST